MALLKVNPWKWQDQFAFSQAIEASGATRTLYCAGQASVDGEGRPMHAGNMSAQLDASLPESRDRVGSGGLHAE